MLGKKEKMEKVLGVFRPKVTPQEQLREWQRKLRQESRNIERQIRGKELMIFLPHFGLENSLKRCYGVFFE